MNMENEIILTIRDLDNLFERNKLESLPKEWLVEILVRHLKREIKVLEYIENYIIYEDDKYNMNVKVEFKEIKNILKGDNND